MQAVSQFDINILEKIFRKQRDSNQFWVVKKLKYSNSFIEVVHNFFTTKQGIAVSLSFETAIILTLSVWTNLE